MANKETIIISLGGSLVVPENIDVEFLKNFKKIILKFLKSKKIIIIVGGGKTARNYLKALKEFGVADKNRDWMGINITKLNAELVKNIFSKNEQKKIIISGGLKPGNSTDYVSVLMAKKYKTKTIINLSNIDYVYDKNPKEFPDAKHFENINWKDFQKIVGTKWIPGLNAPFDPKASLMATKQKMKVVIINGSKLKELENFLENKSFVGTIIE
jgi:uridylate kinase